MAADTATPAEPPPRMASSLARRSVIHVGDALQHRDRQQDVGLVAAELGGPGFQDLRMDVTIAGRETIEVTGVLVPQTVAQSVDVRADSDSPGAQPAIAVEAAGYWLDDPVTM